MCTFEHTWNNHIHTYTCLLINAYTNTCTNIYSDILTRLPTLINMNQYCNKTNKNSSLHVVVFINYSDYFIIIVISYYLCMFWLQRLRSSRWRHLPAPSLHIQAAPTLTASRFLRSWAHLLRDRHWQADELWVLASSSHGGAATSERGRWPSTGRASRQVFVSVVGGRGLWGRREVGVWVGWMWGCVSV